MALRRPLLPDPPGVLLALLAGREAKAGEPALVIVIGELPRCHAIHEKDPPAHKCHALAGEIGHGEVLGQNVLHPRGESLLVPLLLRTDLDLIAGSGISPVIADHLCDPITLEA